MLFFSFNPTTTTNTNITTNVDSNSTDNSVDNETQVDIDGLFNTDNGVENEIEIKTENNDLFNHETTNKEYTLTTRH